MTRLPKLAALLIAGILALLPASLHAQDASQTIEVHAHRFSFEPAEITVKQGETVHLHLVSDDVAHSLLIKDLDVNQAVSKGHPADVTFTAKNAGDFHGKCGKFCGSGHGSMVFTVHVTPN
ncbi:cupredoxin domain-containing protein [Alloacidobacterium dinghuense]|uniref:Cupredoxin domain-containing protein n=1 Tax=Alloacidobacterium dinghuense TaxID=2763107 RepID=A0A7G8BDX6_9BACT|nr:cupredoxin domain-containing protein [Alloacidobacterium dinghuense]QNI30746.1 cupredoxin domain-containing protein [Alloacidobacterium dinghuense]